MKTQLVHGYLCVEEPDDVQIALLCKDMLRFCLSSDFRLGTIFIDRGVLGDVFARSGFTSLLAALRQPQAHAVVVPTLDHLSTQEFVRDALMRMVLLTDSQVFIAYEVNGSGPAAATDSIPGATP